MKKQKLFWFIFPTYIFILALSTICIGFLTSSNVKNFFFNDIKEDLQKTNQNIHSVMEAAGMVSTTYDPILRKVSKANEIRITLIDQSGLVFFDSHHNTYSMDNHIGRQEVQEALSSGSGSSERYSKTLKKQLIYVATLFNSEQPFFVRTSYPITFIQSSLATIVRKILIGTIVVFIVATIIALFVSQKITSPIVEVESQALQIANGNLKLKPQEFSWFEIDSLSQSISSMAHELKIKLENSQNQKQELESLFSNMVEGIVALNDNYEIAKYNQSFLRNFQIFNENLIGQNLFSVLDYPNLRDMVRKLNQESPLVEQDLTLKVLDNEVIFQTRASLLNDINKKELGILIVFNNVTQLRRLESIRSEFVANVSHELKTPITSIKGFVETLIQNKMENPEIHQKFLGIIEEQTDRLNFIIDDILQLSSIEQQETNSTVEKTLIEICPLVNSIIQQLQKSIQKKNVTVINEIPPETQISANSNLFSQAITNLITNAIKYSDSEKTVKIFFEEHDSYVHIAVKDQGYGIDAEHLPRIFERFYRTDKARSRALGGTGLGLSIVKHIAQAHGGHVFVESQINQGSQFTIQIPKV